MTRNGYKIVSFYEFRRLRDLDSIKTALIAAMESGSVFGTVILATEGFNSTVCGTIREVDEFVCKAEAILGTKIDVKSSFHDRLTFKRRKVKIKDEIVTLRKKVEFECGEGTHVGSVAWNRLISDPETFVLDARNDYEVRIGKFRNAHNPETNSFSELPDYVSENLHPGLYKRVAMYCTGGIRCEKFAPYLIAQGFDEVYQLKGGILRYLEETSESKCLWDGECFVFDERISLDEDLNKGAAEDLSTAGSKKG